MRISGVVFGILWLVSTVCPAEAATAEGEEIRNPIPMGLALKLGPYQLTKVLDWGESEAGRDAAANVYARALRIKTEYSIALRDIQLVDDLDEWRTLLEKCRCGVWSVVAAYSGGGTMWGHNAEREAAPVEDFLAGLATRLPLKRGAGSKDAARQIDKAIAHMKSLNVDSEVVSNYRESVREVTASWLELKEKIATLPKAEADRIAAFVVEHAMTLEKAGEG